MMVDENKQAPFNMALYTLESIRKWIDKIAEVSMGVSDGVILNPNDCIIIKRKMVRQLIVLSTPLLNETQLETVMDEYKKVKLNTVRAKVNNAWVENFPQYSADVDEALDVCVQKVEQELQECGHFMPGADESSLF